MAIPSLAVVKAIRTGNFAPVIVSFGFGLLGAGVRLMFVAALIF